MITSLQNPRVKATVRLRDGRHRQKQGRFLIDGLREIDRALIGGFKLETAYYCSEYCQPTETADLLKRLAEKQADLCEVSAEVFAKMAFGHRLEGIVAVAEIPRRTLEEFESPKNPFLAVIEGVEKPGNLGAILRSADAAGVDAVIVADGRTDLFNPNAIRASLGTIFTVPLFEATAEETLDWLRRAKIELFAARVDGSVPYTQVDYSGPSAVVLGSEAHGLTEFWSAEVTRAIRLPMLGVADSLNLSVTAAVLFYEALRQRHLSKKA